MAFKYEVQPASSSRANLVCEPLFEMGSIRYIPLNQARQEIRLLCLHPGEWTDSLSISLQISSLHSLELPFFEAVSYTWGNPSVVGAVIYSEMTISVAKSVENVLRRFRFAKSTRYGNMKNPGASKFLTFVHKSSMDRCIVH